MEGKQVYPYTLKGISVNNLYTKSNEKIFLLFLPLIGVMKRGHQWNLLSVLPRGFCQFNGAGRGKACFLRGGAACFSAGRGKHPWWGRGAWVHYALTGCANYFELLWYHIIVIQSNCCDIFFPLSQRQKTIVAWFCSVRSSSNLFQ